MGSPFPWLQHARRLEASPTPHASYWYFTTTNTSRTSMRISTLLFYTKKERKPQYVRYKWWRRRWWWWWWWGRWHWWRWVINKCWLSYTACFQPGSVGSLCGSKAEGGAAAPSPQPWIVGLNSDLLHYVQTLNPIWCSWLSINQPVTMTRNVPEQIRIYFLSIFFFFKCGVGAVQTSLRFDRRTESLQMFESDRQVFHSF